MMKTSYINNTMREYEQKSETEIIRKRPKRSRPPEAKLPNDWVSLKNTEVR
jgi:hypothetical protein